MISDDAAGVRIMAMPRLLMRILLLALLLPGATGVASARAGNLMSADDARRLMFPDASGFEPVAPAVLARALKQLGNDPEVTMVAARVVALRVMRDGAPAGWFITDDVIGKFEKIDYAIALSEAGVVTRVEVLKYRESHGHEVAGRGWLAQFEGMSAASPVKLRRDVDGISGATLSCVHMADGVRRISRLVAILRQAGV